MVKPYWATVVRCGLKPILITVFRSRIKMQFLGVEFSFLMWIGSGAGFVGIATQGLATEPGWIFDLQLQQLQL